MCMDFILNDACPRHVISRVSKYISELSQQCCNFISLSFFWVRHSSPIEVIEWLGNNVVQGVTLHALQEGASFVCTPCYLVSETPSTGTHHAAIVPRGQFGVGLLG